MKSNNGEQWAAAVVMCVGLICLAWVLVALLDKVVGS